MKPPPTVLVNAFYAFYDLHRPAYRAYAAARLAPEEAQIAVSHLFDLVASNWTTVVAERRPSAWAWELHTRTVARRSGHTLTAMENTRLLHDELHMSIEQIATVTGAEQATVSTLLAAARRAQTPAQFRTRPGTGKGAPPAPARLRRLSFRIAM
ncbi:hypothetical protein AB0C61_29225 [Streptomyces sp. NPDC048680]|uniref:hypothetical protein n=1 Tax=Streptomyces sp. NPDC048680 TaxID=3155492 RepID=UPI0034358A55